MAGTLGRVAVIGLDAAEWSLLDPMMAAGEFPHLARLRRRSAVAVLTDPDDYRTGLVWEHFLTGRSAAGNRRWAAVEFDPATYATWQEGARQQVPFYITSPPVRTVLFDVPYAPLQHAVDGVLVVGWGGHDPGNPRAARPAGLLREIDARFGPHPAFGNDYSPSGTGPRRSTAWVTRWSSAAAVESTPACGSCRAFRTGSCSSRRSRSRTRPVSNSGTARTPAIPSPAHLRRRSPGGACTRSTGRSTTRWAGWSRACPTIPPSSRSACSA